MPVPRHGRTLGASRPTATNPGVYVALVDHVEADGPHVEVASVAPGFVIGPCRFPDRFANPAGVGASRPLARGDAVVIGFVAARTDEAVILDRLA